MLFRSEEHDLSSDEKFYEKGYVFYQNPDANSSSQVTEGTSITIYVSTGVVNYEFDVTVSLPNDFSSTTGKVSLWIDNGGRLFKESEKLDFTVLKDYTFRELVSTDKSMNFIVKIDDKKYMEIEVNTASGKVTKLRQYDEYKASSGNTTSDNSSKNTGASSSNASSTTSNTSSKSE